MGGLKSFPIIVHESEPVGWSKMGVRLSVPVPYLPQDLDADKCAV